MFNRTTYKTDLFCNNKGTMNETEKLKRFGKNIAKYRKQMRYSQNILSDALGISREHLAKIETAKRGVSIGLLFRLAETLNVTEADLFDFK